MQLHKPSCIPTTFLLAALTFLHVKGDCGANPGEDRTVSAVVRMEPAKAGKEIDLSHLLGTNLALWHERDHLASRSFSRYLKLWSPGLIRLPGGSWSNEYYWNGNGVRLGRDRFEKRAFKDGRWQVDYRAYAPGFRVHGIGQELAHYHGAIDVKFQHELAERYGADQMVTVNVGTGTPEMAVEWLKWTRRQDYSVPYWEIGNELNGQWEVGHFLPDGSRMTGEIYAQRFAEYARALKAVDPDIRVGGPASSDLSLAFAEELLRDAGELVDFVTFHAYPVGVQRSDIREKFKDIDLLREALATLRGWKKQYQPDRYDEIEIGVTEWNMKVNEDRDTADLINALWSAAWIGAMMEGEVTLSNQWDLLTRTAEGGHGVFFPDGNRLIPTAIYWAHYLWSRHMGNRFVPCSIEGGDHLEVFATRSEKGIHVMLVNTSPRNASRVELQVPAGMDLAGTGLTATLSHREYFWDPHHHRPLWSLPPTIDPVAFDSHRRVTVPAFSIQVVKIPFAGKRFEEPPAGRAPGKPSLRLVYPESAPADLPLEIWVAAWDEKNSRPYPGPVAPVSIDLDGPGGRSQLELELDQSVARLLVPAGDPGLLRLAAVSGSLEAVGEIRMEAVESRPRVIWTFDNPVAEWGASGTFGIGMEPSVKPNEFVAEAILDNALPGSNADVLMLLEELPEALPLEHIGGVVGEMQASPDFQCGDPGARVNVVLQSEADHWMVLGSIPLEKMRGRWEHFRFDVADSRRLKAMARLYAVRFQLQSEAPVRGEVYFDNLGFLLRGTAAQTATVQEPVEKEKPKNVLFIAVDDLKPALGAYGVEAHTPAMDRLAHEGTRFTNAHCQQAVCGPSRASLLTGMYPDYTRVWDLKTKIRDIRPDIVTLPQHFRSRGYVTAGVGKIFDPRSVDKGLDTLSWTLPFAKTWELDYHPGHGKPAAHYHDPQIKAWAAEAEASGISEWGAVNQYLKERDGWPAFESEDVPDTAYEDGAIAGKGVEYIRELAGHDNPFFIAVGFKKPHLPFVAPQRYWDFYDRDAFELAAFRKRAKGSPHFAYHGFPELRSYSGIPQKGSLPEDLQRTLIHGYHACVSFIDAQVARLMEALEEAGVADETVIVLWGDHGFHLGDHGLWCKHTNYEQATRVPLVLAGPSVKDGAEITAPVGLVDLFPTLCDLAGIDKPDTLQGVSLKPVLEGTAESAGPFAVMQYPRGRRMGYAVRIHHHRYVAWFEKGKTGDIPDGKASPVAEELFDYATDPLETVNVIDQSGYREEAGKLRAMLRTFLENQRL